MVRRFLCLSKGEEKHDTRRLLECLVHVATGCSVGTSSQCVQTKDVFLPHILKLARPSMGPT